MPEPLSAAPAATQAADTSRTSRAALLRGLLRLGRPRQWTKNLLVFAAPGAAGVLLEPLPLARTITAFVAFCLAASGVYCLNDVVDLAEDRLHPRRRARPVAAGTVPVGTALTAGAGLLGVAIAAGGWLLDMRFALMIALYVALMVSYSLTLKHIAIIDLATVAAGFVIRAIAGGVATQVEISSWFLIVASFGSLFIVAGKRHAEHADLGRRSHETRAVLAAYTLDYLRSVRIVAAAVTLLAYCLWAFEEAAEAGAALWLELSIVPFTLGILRYELLLEAGLGHAPEEVIASDRALQLIGVVWLATFAAGVYAR